jgi:quercetin dioxygenase-like cupin family protein
MDDANPRRERLSFLDRDPPPRFDVRWVTVAPGGRRPYDEADWRDALVIVERGPIELECTAGGRRSFKSGDIMWLVGLPLRALHNPGPEPAVLAAVSRSDEFSAVLPSTPESEISRRPTP